MAPAPDDGSAVTLRRSFSALGRPQAPLLPPPPLRLGPWPRSFWLRVVVPLWLLKQSNDEQMAKLFALLRLQPAPIHWYLEQIVFPTYTQHQHVKLSSSGQVRVRVRVRV